MRAALGLGFALAVALLVWVAARLTVEPMDPALNEARPSEPAAGELDPRANPVEPRAVVESAHGPPRPAAVEEPNSGLARLEASYGALERELARERQQLFDARFAAGDFAVVAEGAGPLTPERTLDGLDVEVSWRQGERDGEPVLEVVTLPVEQYPNYYRRVAERNALRQRIDELARNVDGW